MFYGAENRYYLGKLRDNFYGAENLYHSGKLRDHVLWGRKPILSPISSPLQFDTDFQSQTFLQIVIILLILNLHALYQSLAKYESHRLN